jgi:hypothetical protein
MGATPVAWGSPPFYKNAVLGFIRQPSTASEEGKVSTLFSLPLLLLPDVSLQNALMWRRGGLTIPHLAAFRLGCRCARLRNKDMDLSSYGLAGMVPVQRE